MTPARTGKGRQSKGRNFERKIIQALWKMLGKEPPWKAHARPDDGYVPPPELNTMHFEMKNQVTLNIRPWWKQAKEDRDPGQAPVLIFALDSKQVLVTMAFEDWQWLVDLALGRRRRTLDALHELKGAVDLS